MRQLGKEAKAKMSNYTCIDYQFLQNHLNRKQMGLVCHTNYAFRFQTKKGVTKREIALKANITPQSLNRSIERIFKITKQQIIYDKTTKHVIQSIVMHQKNQKYVQIPTFFLTKRILAHKCLVVLGYLRTIGGQWDNSAYQLKNKLNNWLKKNIWEDLQLSYNSVLEALKILEKLGLVNTNKKIVIKTIDNKETKCFIYEKIFVNQEMVNKLDWQKLIQGLEKKKSQKLTAKEQQEIFYETF